MPTKRDEYNIRKTHLAGVIREKREEINDSVKTFCHERDVGVSVWRKLESYGPGTLVTLWKASEALGITASELLAEIEGGEDD